MLLSDLKDSQDFETELHILPHSSVFNTGSFRELGNIRIFIFVKRKEQAAIEACTNNPSTEEEDSERL